MPKKKFEQQLADLEELRASAGDASTPDRLRKALADRNNYVVARAARITEEVGVRALIPDLLSAFDRFFIDPVKSDPQCWAKNALVQALASLDHNDSTVFLRGLRHVQREPVWGGQGDTAAALGIEVIGMGPGAAPTTGAGPSSVPSTFFSALARLTGAVDSTTGRPLVLSTTMSNENLTKAIVESFSTA